MRDGERRPVYLDHAATSPLLPEAREALLEALGTSFENPSSPHLGGRRARRLLDEARERLAALLRCAPGEVLFTSGGTESDNLAIRGVLEHEGGRVLCSAVEHHAVLRAAERFEHQLISVDADGQVDLDALADALRPGAALVSVMAANNETGALQPIGALSELVREQSPGTLVHCDAVQGFPAPGPEAFEGADLVSLSAHKFGGPKGVGVLVVRAGARHRLTPLHLGGAQELGLRAGTENLPSILAAVRAAEVMVERRDEAPRVEARRDLLGALVRAGIEGAYESAAAVARVPTICHLVLPGISAEEMVLVLDELGVAVSPGAACASGALEASHVLRAMGLPEHELRSGLRFSLSFATTDEEVERAAAATIAAASRLRAGSAERIGEN